MGPCRATLEAWGRQPLLRSQEIPTMTQAQAADLRALIAELTRSGQHAEAAAVASLLD